MPVAQLRHRFPFVCLPVCSLVCISTVNAEWYGPSEYIQPGHLFTKAVPHCCARIITIPGARTIGLWYVD